MSDQPNERRSVVVERDFPHSPEKLWRALTEPHLIQEWLMRNDFAPEVGHRFTMTGDWGGTLECEVLAVAPNRSLSYTWNFNHADPALALQSVVTFTLTPTGAGAHLRLEQSGFRAEQTQAIGGAQFGWRQFFDKLEPTLAGIDS